MCRASRVSVCSAIQPWTICHCSGDGSWITCTRRLNSTALTYCWVITACWLAGTETQPALLAIATARMIAASTIITATTADGA